MFCPRCGKELISQEGHLYCFPTEFREFIHEVAEFCRRHHITRLSLFGSVLREDFGPESDIDILVEFDPQHIPGLQRFLAYIER